MHESYLAFYGLTSDPFSNAPVTRFYYESEQHRHALTRLTYALESMKGLAVVIGGIGTGKTTLARRLLDALPDAEFESALLVIIHAGVDATWLLKRIAMQLGVIDPAEEKLTLLAQLYQRLVQIYESGKKAVVLIDEAQMLATRELMEEFRGLLNLELPGKKLLSLVFFGLPEIDKIMLLDPPLKQRVALKFRLEGLSRDATEHYINHRLQLAGATKPLFPRAAIDVVFEATAGTPRLINTVCDNVLLEGFLNRAQAIDAPLVRTVVENLGIDPSEYGDSLEDDRKARTELHTPIARTAPPPAQVTSKATPPVAAKSAAPKPAMTPNPRPASTPSSPTQAAPSIAMPHAVQPKSAKPVLTPIAELAKPVLAPSAELEGELFGDNEPSPLGAPKSTEPPKPTLKKTTVNLDEIDSLLAQIKKPIG